MIAKDHLRACREHGVVADRGVCPVCEIDGIEARPEAFSSRTFMDLDLRWQISHEVMMEGLPKLRDEAKELGHGAVFVAVGEVSVKTVRNAAGYTDQERWFNVIGVEIKHDSDRCIKRDSDVRDIIETIDDGFQYLPTPSDTDRRLEPDEWMTVIAPYIDGEDGVEFEMMNDDRLRMRLSVGSEEIHQIMRRDIGVVARNFGLKAYTRQKGNWLQDSIIEVSR